MDSSGTTYFFYDGDNLLAEVDGSDNLMVVYEWGVRGLLSQWRDGSRYYYHFDGLGSTVQITDANQNVVKSYKYDAWGNDLTDPSSSIPNPFRYVGRLGYYADKDSGLMLLGVRYYNASVGRFWSLDPRKDGRNWYKYVENNPSNKQDPSGLGWVYVVICITATICWFAVPWVWKAGCWIECRRAIDPQFCYTECVNSYITDPYSQGLHFTCGVVTVICGIKVFWEGRPPTMPSPRPTPSLPYRPIDYYHPVYPYYYVR